MIADEQHRTLHFAAQAVCFALPSEIFAMLSQEARVALVQLAIYASATSVAWWPEWAPSPAELQAVLPDSAKR